MPAPRHPAAALCRQTVRRVASAHRRAALDFRDCRVCPTKQHRHPDTLAQTWPASAAATTTLPIPCASARRRRYCMRSSSCWSRPGRISCWHRLSARSPTSMRCLPAACPDSAGVDTVYHDRQHTLDVTLAMARLLAGYERQVEAERALGSERAAAGVILALFHDVGYLRRSSDREQANGAEFTLNHVSRGADFLSHYLPQIGLRAMGRRRRPDHPLHRLRAAVRTDPSPAMRAIPRSGICSARRT